jgi:uncharacterized protein YneF (UPF0154 family)
MTPYFEIVAAIVISFIFGVVIGAFVMNICNQKT